MKHSTFSFTEQAPRFIRKSQSGNDVKFLNELNDLLWQRFRQTLPEMLDDLYKQNSISSPDLPVQGIVRELNKMRCVHDVIAPLVKKYRLEN